MFQKSAFNAFINKQKLNKILTLFGVIIYLIFKNRTEAFGACFQIVSQECEKRVYLCIYWTSRNIEMPNFCICTPTLKATSVYNDNATLAPSRFNTFRRHYYQKYLQALLTKKNKLWIQNDLRIIITQNFKSLRITVKKIMQFL